MKKLNKILVIVFCVICIQSVYSQTVSWQQQPCWDEVELFGDNLLKVKQMNQWGLVDFDGTIVLPCKYAKMTTPREDHFLVLDDNNKLLSLGDSSGKIVQVNGNWFVDETWPYFTNGLLAVQNAQGLWGYMDKVGKIVIKEKYKNAFPFFYGYASVCENGTGNWHLIDVKGKPIDLIDGKQHQKNFAFASSFTKIDDKSPVAFVLVSDRVYFMDFQGNINGDIISKEGAAFSSLNEERLFECIDGGEFMEIKVNALLEIVSIVKDKAHYNCSLNTDNIISYPQVQGISIERDGTIKVGTMEVSPQFQESIPLTPVRVLVKKNDKWGLLALNPVAPSAKITFKNALVQDAYHAIPLSFQIEGNDNNTRAYSVDKAGNMTFWRIDSATNSFQIPMSQLNGNMEAIVTVGLETDGVLLAPTVFTTQVNLRDGFTVTGPTKVTVDKNGHGSFDISICNNTEQAAMPFDVIINEGGESHFNGLQSQQCITIPVEIPVKIPALEDYVYKPIKVTITENGMPERTYKITIRFAKAYIKG